MRTLLWAGAFALLGCGEILGADFDVVVPANPTVEIGAQCGEPDALRCADQRVVAVCAQGAWVELFACAESEHCESKPEAACIADTVFCDGVQNQRKCVGTTSITCDANGDVESTTDCPGPCVADGVCLDVVQVAVGGHTCALVSDQTVWCWGMNKYGQLGQVRGWGTTEAVPPRVVPNLTGVEEIVAGFDFSCARVGGKVACWGHGIGTAEIGDGPVDDFIVSEVSTLSDVVELDAGDDTVCARTEPGTVYCWGVNSSGQLCLPDQAAFSLPQHVVALDGAEEIFIGPRDSCARFPDQSVRCCGGNDYASGLAQPGLFNPEPKQVLGIDSVATADIGDGHMCVVDSTGSVLCWGKNHFGSLCLGHFDNALEPEPTLLKNVDSLRIGSAATFALGTNRALSCCGNLCGISSAVEYRTSVPVPLLAGAVDAVDADAGHACAIVQGRVLCWGMNSDGRIKIGLEFTVVKPTPAGW